MQNVKGTFDFWGTEQALRARLRNELEEVFGLYDFEPMETPVLNEQELLESKYAGGDEIRKEMYRLSDQGGRKLALRYDLTIPLAKVAAMNPGLRLPFKRYEIGKVFRDGPVKRGRLREFVQCDADVVGVQGPEAELELMQLALQLFDRLGIAVVVRWNNRRLLGELLAAVGVAEPMSLSVMLTLDKAAKIGLPGVREELAAKGMDNGTIGALLTIAGRDDWSLQRLASELGLGDGEGLREAAALQRLIERTGLSMACMFDPFLSRGLSFYTGTVYEIFDASGNFTSSLSAGGRYDNMIGKLAGQELMRVPAVGISFGLESIAELLRERGKPEPLPAVVMIPVGDTLAESLVSAAVLRSAGIRVRLESGERKLKKALASAAALGVRSVILIGEEEAKRGQIRLKNMEDQTELLLTVEDAIAYIGT